MQPLINLKAFVAVLVILAVPGAFFVAYFRGGPPEGDAAAQHGPAGHSHAGAGGMSGMSGMGGGAGTNAKGDDHGASGHGAKMNMAEADGDHSKMDMASAPKPQSLYSVGGEGFFLDQSQVNLSVEQIQRLGQIRDRTVQGRNAAEQKIRQAEEALWKETSAAKPVQPAITTQVREIERMRADMRLALILAVGEAADVLTAEQRKMIPRDDTNSAKPAETPAPAHKDH